MIRRDRRFQMGDRGQTLIEFALITPIIFIIVFMILDFGIAMDRRIVLEHAVREGARSAAVNTDVSFDDGSVQDITAHQAQGIINKSDVIVCYMDPKTNTLKANPDVGDAADVCETSFKYNFFFINNRFFGLNIPAVDMSLTGSSRLEQKPTGSSDARCPCPTS